MRSEKLGLVNADNELVREYDITNTKKMLEWAKGEGLREGDYKIVRLTGVEFNIGNVMRTELTLK